MPATCAPQVLTQDEQGNVGEAYVLFAGNASKHLVNEDQDLYIVGNHHTSMVPVLNLYQMGIQYLYSTMGRSFETH